jgi:predicted O-methyltransferase YrrM
MNQVQWTAVDRYIGDLFHPADTALDAAIRASETAGLPSIQVTPPLGKLLYLLARIRGARRILEIGTLGGYSTIWLARALPPGGNLVTLELEPKHGEVARANVARAGLAAVVEIRLGPAQGSLAALVAERAPAFDMIFIDADKPSYPDYLARALDLARPGTLIVADNVVRNGAVIDEGSADARVSGARRFNERLAAEPRVEATVIQTVGSKGYDGFAIAVVGEGG